MSLDIVILAAGQGKRMHSACPKVLHPLAGKPLLRHVVDTARSLNAARIVIVYGHGGETVREALNAPDINFAKQDPQLGTGHAVMQAHPLLGGAATDAITLVLYGDVPLTQAASLRALLDAAAGGALAILTVDMPDPSGYGRIVRDGTGRIARIVEHKDATVDERKITEVNTGIMAIPTARLAGWLTKLSNSNAQGEYYLTDIVAMAVAEGVAVSSARPGASP